MHKLYFKSNCLALWANFSTEICFAWKYKFIATEIFWVKQHTKWNHVFIYIFLVECRYESDNALYTKCLHTILFINIHTCRNYVFRGSFSFFLFLIRYRISYVASCLSCRLFACFQCVQKKTQKNGFFRRKKNPFSPLFFPNFFLYSKHAYTMWNDSLFKAKNYYRHSNTDYTL